MKKEAIIRKYRKTVLSLLTIITILCTPFVSFAVDSGSVHVQDRISFSDEGQIGNAKMILVPFPGLTEE